MASGGGGTRRVGPAAGATARRPTGRRTGGRALGLAIAALGVAGVAVARGPVEDPGCGTLALRMRASTLVYRLPRTFLRAGSDSAWTRFGTWRRGVDYVIEPMRGELRLLREPLPDDTLWVKGCWLLDPPPLELRLNAYRPGPGVVVDSSVTRAATVASRPATAHRPDEAPAGTVLSLTGNKTIAVDFGSSQDAFLRQSLDLAVSGTLGPGVQLTGVLSDRNTPLTAGGTTQDLQSLDRVLVELTAPEGSATLGDISLNLTQGEFARLDRRLQGVRGQWSAGGFQFGGAAASAQGEYHRLQLFGIEGRQGPYRLTDANGNSGVSVVAESEVVTLDGQRMTRGESADYSIDYERGQITFTNRRPITFASRITVDYQFALNRYRRNLAAAGGRWTRGSLYGFTQVVTENDDRGRPLDLTLDASDQLVLAFAGDSAARALGPGVRAGGGDYDTVRVGGAFVFAFVAPDSGRFAVQFARVADGVGDYVDSTNVAGRIAYRWVGPGRGTHRVGRALPLPESHQVWAVGGGLRRGALGMEVEGALSNLDRNTFSSLDDGNNTGRAGRAALRLEGSLPGALGGAAGLALEGRAVDRRFAPFDQLERPFAEEDWGLPPGVNFERQNRLELSGFLRPRLGGEVRTRVGRLETADGFRSLKRGVEWSRDGRLATQARWERADGRQAGRRFADGGRERLNGELRLRLPWLEPAVRAATDERRFPSDSGRVGDRFREAGVDLQGGRALRWRASVGLALRRDAQATATGFADQSQTRTWKAALESPAGGRVGAGLLFQRRDLEPLGNPLRTRSDLASARLRVEDPARGVRGLLNLEVTSEGENRRSRTLTYVGPGRGTYDAFGNLVGIGDYELVIAVSPDLERVARAASSARLGWDFGSTDAWRGSRVEFTFEAEARRRGELRLGDVAVAPGAALADAGLSRGSVLQRLETELGPGSAIGSLRLRGERRVAADRSFDNFAQTTDERVLDARLRSRTGTPVSAELEGRLRKQIAAQTLVGGGAFDRVLIERRGVGRLVYSPDARLRAVGVLEATWSRPQGQIEFTRTLRIGPDLGLAVGPRGRLDLNGRRSFVAGPAPVGLLPSADPAGAPRWEGTTRFDYRVRESTTLSLSFLVRERPNHPVQSTGRAELRAFF